MPLSQLQRHARHGGLGSSDAAPALGLSPYKTALELYEEKLRPLELADEPTGPLLWGHLLEPVIRQHYANLTGLSVEVPSADVVYRHREFPFLLANPDGIVQAADKSLRVFEAKTARSADGWGEPGTDAIPQAYVLQCQHLMLVTAIPVCDVAVLIGGSDFRQYTLEADAELQELLLDGLADFWSGVQTETPPPVDFKSPRALEVVRKMFPGTDGSTVTADAALEAWYAVYTQAEEFASLYAKQADGAKAHLLYMMGEAAELRFADGKCMRRKLTTRKAYSVDAVEYIDARIVKAKD